MTAFFTIGHSTRPLKAFVALLHESQVSLVVDVRAIPRSRTNPQYNRDSLPEALAGFGIGYEHIAELGGRRGTARPAEPSPNGFWRVAGFRNYADHALTDDFAEGFARLRDLGARQRSAVMCAEAVPWRCHRRIIADYLIAAGETVCHILGPGRVDPAALTPGARSEGVARIVYPGTADDPD